MGDRLAGLALLGLAVWYGVVASGFEAAIGDPLGPAAFPIALAVPLALLSLYMILRPDPEPDWARGRAPVRQGLALAAFVAYAYLLEPLGFVVATALGTAVMGLLLGARPWQAGATGVAAAVALFLLFNNLLGLPLPAGVLGGLGAP